MSKKKHKKSRHRTHSPKEEDEKSANKHRRVATDKIEAGNHDHHGPLTSEDRKRKTENRDKILPPPKKPSPEEGREVKKPVYRLAATAGEKDSRKREEDIVPKREHHRRHEERHGEKKLSETSHAASTKDRKRTLSSSETSQSQPRSSTSSPQKSKASRHHTQEGCTVSGARASRSTAASATASASARTAARTAASPAKSASVDLQEQRTKLVKRRTEGEDPEPPAKTSRSTPTLRRQSEELREERKKLVERRRSTEEVEAKASSTKQEKGVTQGKTRKSNTLASSFSSSSSSSSSAKLSGSAQPDSGSTVQQAPRTSASGTESHASPKPQPSISFRIPKKPSAPPPPRVNIWEQDDESTEQPDITPTKPLSTAKAAHITASFIPRSLTKARPLITSFKPLSLTKTSQVTASFKPLSTAKTSQTTASSKPLSTTTPVQATVSFKPLPITKAVSATAPSKPPPITKAARATGPSKPPPITKAVSATAPSKPLPITKAARATAPSKLLPITKAVRATAPSKPLSTTGAGLASISPKPPSTPRAGPASTGPLTPVSTTKSGQNAASFKPFSEQAAASPQPLSTPRAAQAVDRTPPTYTPQQPEKDNNVPRGFYSVAASFSTPGHPPVQAQAGVDAHPSFWSPQTVPEPSFILQEDNHDNDQEMQLLEELQQARCEHLLEVNVVESYGELTAMDIDPPEEGTAPTSMLSKELIQQDLLIVLDTNILLSHLDLVKKIRSQGLRSLGFPTMLIPWVVLQELDAIKNGKLTNAVTRRATPAVNYIYNCLKNQEPRLWGQSMQQASLALCGLKTENNDDRVLQCCLQYQKLYPKSGLILCTNDKNLCSKAVLSGVRALSKADLLQEVDRLKAGVLSTTPTADQRIACPGWPPAEKDESRSREEAKSKSERAERAVEEEEERRRALAAARELSESVCVLEDTLKDVLSAILQQEMKEAYGDLWTEIVYLKPPWSLSHVLQCVKKHWIAVFGSIVQRGLQSYISQLNDCLCTNKTVDRERMLQALSLAVELLTGFSSRSHYSGLLPQSLNTLQGLLQHLQPQPSRCPKADDDSVMLEVEEASQETPVTHQDVWQLFENIWSNLLGHSADVFTALQFTPSSMETPPSRKSSLSSQDALCELQKLGVAVAQLLQCFERLLSADCSVNDAQSLLTFIEATKVAALEPRFTAQALCDCLSQQEYRQKLCTGGSQLLQLQVDLERCAAGVEQAWS
ncbi:bromodomain-containing protein 4 [Sardina pilchardus]|uniref:bromodomain-containing protein 4 n=1 Tax=Sardina pilchardus TaxID=27697 RepID=UPI002E112DA0